MAWQQGPQPNGVGAMNAPESSGVQAYTLQGVMRFLQTEWHRHERDRNAWEIEREEMKKRIAGLEGEAKSNKGMRTILERQVRMLEIAIKRERETVTKLKSGESVDTSLDSKEQARQELKNIKESALNSLPKTVGQFDNEIDAENHLAQGIRQEKERDKSKAWLNKCASEVTYRVLPGTHVPPETTDLNLSTHLVNDRQPSQQELHDAYAQIQAQKQQQMQQSQPLRNNNNNNIQMARDNVIPSQPPLPAYSDPASLSRSNTQLHNMSLPIRELNQKMPEQPLMPLTNADTRRSIFGDQLPSQDDQVESVSYTYDAYGKQLPAKHENDTQQTIDRTETDVSDGWDFDDGPPPPPLAPHEQSPQRPDVEAFPSALASKSPTRAPGSHRRRSSGARRKSADAGDLSSLSNNAKTDPLQFKIKYAMRGHLDVVRCVIFTGGGSPADPEFCTASDDGLVKRWHMPKQDQEYLKQHSNPNDDLDQTAHFTHRGHVGAVCSLAACPAILQFSSGGRIPGDGWIFSGGEDTSVRLWERGRVDPKATLEGHTDAVWALCVLPGNSGSILGDMCSHHGGPDRIILAAGAADGTILIWAVSAPPHFNLPQGGSNRGQRTSRRANSMSAGSNFPTSPQPSVATNTPFHYSLVHRIERPDRPSPTSIVPLSPAGESFVVSYSNANILIFDTKTGEEIVGMASQESSDGFTSPGSNAVNDIVASTTGFDNRETVAPNRRGSMGEDDVVHGATGGERGVEGQVIAGYEDKTIRFFDANSGQCTYSMLAHPSAISSLSLSPDGREMVSGGHDASLRFWSLEKRACIQEVTSHRIMRGEGVNAVVWSPDGRWVISTGGDGAIKVFTRT